MVVENECIENQGLQSRYDDSVGRADEYPSQNPAILGIPIGNIRRIIIRLSIFPNRHAVTFSMDLLGLSSSNDASKTHSRQILN